MVLEKSSTWGLIGEEMKRYHREGSPVVVKDAATNSYQDFSKVRYLYIPYNPWDQQNQPFM